MRRRLASELKRLAGVRGAAEDVPEPVSALDTLRRIAASLPASLRFRILEMRISPNDLFIEGQVRSQFLNLATDQPPLMRGPAGKTVFQFRRFQVKDLELGIDLMINESVDLEDASTKVGALLQNSLF